MRSSNAPNRSTVEAVCMPQPVLIRICVVYSPAPRQVVEKNFSVAPDCTLGQALSISGILVQCPELDLKRVALGVWGRKASLNQVLRDQDRVEIYRPLTVDPKVARRERFAKQGAKTTGLFAKLRTGAKAGY